MRHLSRIFGLEAARSWGTLARRTFNECVDDDVLGLAAQLSYFFFLALFPAILVLLAFASFFPLATLTDDLRRALQPFVSPPVLELIEDQMRRLAMVESSGILSLGLLGALWSSSAALLSIVGALNRAYDIVDRRSWWKVRLVAMGLTLVLAVLMLCALSLVLAGPSVATHLGNLTGLGTPFKWAWLVLQWPLAVGLASIAIGLVYYFGPDARQTWRRVAPGALAATALWFLVSLAFKGYVARFTDYNASYGTVGGVIAVLLWLYVSSVAILVGAELNGEIEQIWREARAPAEGGTATKSVLVPRIGRAFPEPHQQKKAAEPRS